MWQNKDIYVDSECTIDLLKNINNSDMSQNSNLQSQMTQNHNNEHQAAPPQPIYHNSQQRVLQNQSQPIHLNSSSVNEGKLISTNKTRRTIIHQQQLPFSTSNTSIQSSQSPSEHNINSQQQLHQVSNSSVLHTGNISQRIFIQHQPENVNSSTSTNSYSNSHLQQVRQQQHYVSIPGNQQIHTQQLPAHFIQQPHQILISGNNSNQVQQQFIQPAQSLMHQNTQISALSVQQQPSLYIGSQRFYANSVLSATAAVSSNSIHSTYGDGILVAAAPPASSTSSNNLNELTAAFGGVKSKEMYRELKRKFKYLVYENEYYQEELRNLQRKLLKLSRDKNFLLDRLGSYEIVSDSSDDSDASVKTIEDRNTKIRRRNIGNKSVISRKKNLPTILNGNSVTNMPPVSNLKKNNFGSAFTNTITVTTSVSSIMTTITTASTKNYF